MTMGTPPHCHQLTTMTVASARRGEESHWGWKNPSPIAFNAGLTTPICGSSITVQIKPVATSDRIAGKEDQGPVDLVARRTAVQQEGQTEPDRVGEEEERARPLWRCAGGRPGTSALVTT